ncbi:MAG: CsbD family protein [Fuerstiella sp.]
MITQQELQGNWNQLKGVLQDRWGQLTDEDLSRAKGSVDQLVGVIQQKTGATRTDVESCCQNALRNGAAGLADAAEQVRSYASELETAAQKQYDHASEALNDGLEYAQETVRRRPTESVVVCFGAGLIAGAVLGLMLRNRA